jgi:hypothetical protein
MSFRTTAVVTAIVTFVLGTGYVLAGNLLVGRWDIQPTEGVLVLARRIGAAYLGLSVIFWLAKSLAPSPARSALSAGAVVTCSLLAILGVYERSAGHAASPILISAALEAFLAIAFFRILVVDRRLALQAQTRTA